MRQRELFVLRARGGTQHGEPEDVGGVRSSWSRAGEAGGEARLQTQRVGERRGWRRGEAADAAGRGEARLEERQGWRRSGWRRGREGSCRTAGL